MTTAELQATADGSYGNFGTDQIDFAARARLRKRGRRTQRLRRRVVILSVALFIAAWLAVFVQLASGNDPALRRAAARANARTAAQLRISLSQVTAWGSRQAAISAHRAYSEQILRARIAQARADDALVRKRLLQANARLAAAAAAATKAAAAQAAAAKGSTSASAASAGRLGRERAPERCVGAIDAERTRERRSRRRGPGPGSRAGAGAGHHADLLTAPADARPPAPARDHLPDAARRALRTRRRYRAWRSPAHCASDGPSCAAAGRRWRRGSSAARTRTPGS